MTRIIAGSAGGRRLAVPPQGTRPTSDRVRESLFSALDHALPGWAGLHVLDLYAGSGALGLEAASRGAAHVLLVEKAPKAVAVCRANIAAVGLAGVTVVAGDVARVAADPPPGAAAPPYGLVLADPPYALPTTDLLTVLAALAHDGWLAPGALVVLERAAREQPAWPDGFTSLRERRYGDTALWLGTAPGA